MVGKGFVTLFCCGHPRSSRRSLQKSRGSISLQRLTYFGEYVYLPGTATNGWIPLLGFGEFVPVAQNSLSYTFSNYGISNPIFLQAGQAGAATSEARDTSAFNLRLIQELVRCQANVTIFSYFNRAFDQTSETYRVTRAC